MISVSDLTHELICIYPTRQGGQANYRRFTTLSSSFAYLYQLTCQTLEDQLWFCKMAILGGGGVDLEEDRN